MDLGWRSVIGQRHFCCSFFPLVSCSFSHFSSFCIFFNFFIIFSFVFWDIYLPVGRGVDGPNAFHSTGRTSGN